MKVLKIENAKPLSSSEKIENSRVFKSLHSLKEVKNKGEKRPIENDKVASKDNKNQLDREKEFDSILKKIKERLNPLNKVLKVEIDKDLKVPVFKIIDKDTKEVIRQIPWEETLKLWKALEELLKKEGLEKTELKGIFLEKEV